MKRNLFILICLLTFAVSIDSQNIIDNSIRPTEMLIGEQAQFKIKVTTDVGRKVQFPDYKNSALPKGLEVLDVCKTDTILLNENKRMTIEKTYVLTSFDSTLYYIPAASVTIDGKSFAAKQGVGLKVSTVPVDTAHLDKYFGAKNVASAPFVWSVKWLLISLSFVLLIVLAVVALVKSKRKTPIIRKKIVAPPIAPHKWAKIEIENIKKSPNFQQADSKSYYMSLTNVLREYIEKRFGFNAKEMTSDEIIIRLMKSKKEDSLAELKQIFEIADLVKFAKYKTQLNENDSNLLMALDFVNKTKTENQILQKPIVEEIPLSHKRQIMVKMLLKVVFILCLILSLFVLYLIVNRMIETFF